MMPSKVLINVENLSKHYPLHTRGVQGLRSLWAALRGRQQHTRQHFTALETIHFSVARGESLAIVGENGAGKSTLLKLIAKVAEPSTGLVTVNGTVSALLELGSGFHPEFTGLQNIELNAALLGLSPADTAAKKQSIIDFADIGEAIHKPVKTYSSGMVVRLGFAIATAMKPDLLITDEVMAVGDEAFQKKCIKWIEHYLAQGGTLLLVSHSMYHVQKLCRQALWLVAGQQKMLGNADEVAIAYQSYLADKEAAKADAALHPAMHAKDLSEQTHYQLLQFGISHTVDSPPASNLVLGMGEDLYLSGEVHSPDDRPPHVFVGLVTQNDTGIYGTGSELAGYRLTRIAPKQYRFTMKFQQLSLLPGHYQVKAHAMDPEAMRLFDVMRCHLQIKSNSSADMRALGMVKLPHQWL
ncbi:MAG: teichoic acid transporter ATP-binding protein [Pseudomonadota bacterium]|jgi:lipopolysaccharide transport system ATP-binding protein